MQRLQIYCKVCDKSLGDITAEQIMPHHYESLGCGVCASLVPHIDTPIEEVE